MNKSESDIAEEINKSYGNLGENLGWSLLYTKFETMWNPKYPIAFFGLNPGGSGIETDYISGVACNDGCAYLDQEWEPYKKREHPLQVQLIKLYKLIAKASNFNKPYENLMRDSLMTNFVPFRSKDWNSMTRKQEALNFSSHLWKERIQMINTSLYLTISLQSFSAIKQILEEIGYKEIDSSPPAPMKVGWGNINYEVKEYKKGSHSCALIRLPHLSRYKIFSSEHCKPTLAHLSELSNKYL